MFGIICGVQFVANGCFVHVQSSCSFDDDKKRGIMVEKVYVKNDSFVYDKIFVGAKVYVAYNKVGDKYYANIKF